MDGYCRIHPEAEVSEVLSGVEAALVQQAAVSCGSWYFLWHDSSRSQCDIHLPLCIPSTIRRFAFLDHCGDVCLGLCTI